MHHSFKLGSGRIATGSICWFGVVVFPCVSVFSSNLKRVDNKKVLVAVTPSVLFRCKNLTKKPGRSNEVCHKRFTIVPLNPASPLLLWKHTFRPLNLLQSAQHGIQRCYLPSVYFKTGINIQVGIPFIQVHIVYT